MTTISPICSHTLVEPPSCIAFCPSRPEYFVVGTYYLHRKPPGAPSENEFAENEDTRHSDENPIGSGPQKRDGRLILCRLSESDEVECMYPSEIHTESAVLDFQWAPPSAELPGVLAVAQSTGIIAFYKLVFWSKVDPDASHHAGKPSAYFRLLSTHQVCEPSILILSLTWSDVLPHILGMTLSDGRVSIARITVQPEAEHAEQESTAQSLPILKLGTPLSTQQHGLEAWCMAFALEENASNPPSSASAEKSISILSGGDDMYLRSTRIAIPTSSSSSSEPSDDPPSSTLVFQDRRIHTAGVTALLPLTPNLLITGSYDDHIRLVHIPSAKTNAGGEFERAGPARPQVLAELDLGGGVWRIKTLEETGDDHVADSGKEGPSKMSGRNGVLLLVSCMYAGARIVRLVRSTTGGSDDEDEWAFQVDAQFTEHKSMNYGSDVRPHGLDQVAEGKATMKPEVAGKSDSNGSTRLRRTIVSSSFYDKLLCSWYWEE